MSSSVCETYPGICNKTRLADPGPARLFRPANDNDPMTARPHLVLPAVSLSSAGNSMSLIEAGSVVSMLGLILLAAHEEIVAVAPVLASALDRFFASAPVTLW